MRLTLHTDYALRVMIYLAEHHERLCSIGEISRAYAISHNPMMKIVHSLGKGGFLVSVRGRNGGIKLARSADNITMGAIVRFMEGPFEMADCGSCIIAPGCGFKGVLGRAVGAFLDVLDATSLTDLAHGPVPLAQLWQPGLSEGGDATDARRSGASTGTQ